MALPAGLSDAVIFNVETTAAFRSCLNYISDFDEISLDCEATSTDPDHPEYAKNPTLAQPLLCQVGDDKISFVINLSMFEADDLQPLWELLAERVVVGHNLDYDYRLLRSYYNIPKWQSVYDTMLAEALLTAGDYGDKGTWMKQGLSLKVVAKKYLGVELDKEVRTTFEGIEEQDLATYSWHPTHEQVVYAGLDTIVTMRVALKQMEAIEAENLMAAATNRMQALVPIAEVELRGMKVDADAWRAYLAELEAEKREVEAALVARLDVYEQRWRAEKLKTLQQERDAWDSAKTLEESRLRTLYESLSTSSPRTGSISAPPTSAALKSISETTTSKSSAILKSASTGDLSSTIPTWSQFKVDGMRSWRASHPNPGVPRVEDGPINLNSPEQVKRAYKAMGLTLPTERDPETGQLKETCDAKARDNLLKSGKLSPTQAQVLELHSKYSKLSKLLGSFGENILARLTRHGRLHTQYNIGLTETGRMSSENPNFQNFPRTNRLRHCFVADDGYVVITADFKSQELAIAAARSGDRRMARELSEGRDLYKALAVTVFGLKDESEVTDKQRHAAKSGLLGVSYGLTPVGMERIHGVPRKLGEQVIAAIKTRYPDLFKYAENNVAFGREHGYVTAALGSKRYFRNSRSQTWEIENQSKNHPIQGTAAEVVYAVAYRMETYAVPKGVLPVNFVHDEVVALAPKAMAEEAAQLVVNQMQAAFNDVLPFEEYGVRCGVDVHVAPYWTKD